MSRTFDEVCEDHRVTPAERVALAWHLATFRLRRTVELLGGLSIAAAMITAAAAQQPTDRVRLELSREQIQAIANGIMELPYKQAAPLLNEIARQVQDQAPKPPEPSSSPAPAPEPEQPK